MTPNLLDCQGCQYFNTNTCNQCTFGSEFEERGPQELDFNDPPEARSFENDEPMESTDDDHLWDDDTEEDTYE